MARGVHGTGRTQLIREFLSKHCNEAFNAREIRDAVEPGASIDVFSATLSSMASRGDIARLGAGKGKVHFFWPRGMATLDRRKAPSADSARSSRRPRVSKARATPAATSATGIQPAVSQTAKAISALAIAKRADAPRRAASNFVAPTATPDPALFAKRAASARIEADIAAFERGGGRVERLGVTKLFHHRDDCQD
ncbi:MAG TPA: hypothetical protein VIG97_14465 [Luteimonas sp.]